MEATKAVRDFARTLHGLDESSARAIAEAKGYELRVVMIDGVPRRLKTDRHPRRINVRMSDGQVRETTIG
jgi:hypothetical protein